MGSDCQGKGNSIWMDDYGAATAFWQFSVEQDIQHSARDDQVHHSWGLAYKDYLYLGINNLHMEQKCDVSRDALCYRELTDRFIRLSPSRMV